MSKYHFFWSGPFSQWRRSKFTIDGVEYNTAEQYMMASKARHFGDAEALAQIMATDDPEKQKAIGRTVRNFDADEWNKVARQYVYEGNHAKFTQNPKFYDQLVKTKGLIIVEASPEDRIWGIGLAETDTDVHDPSRWRGLNWLGEVLTKLRIDLIGE